MRKVGYGYESALENYSMEWISQKKGFSGQHELCAIRKWCDFPWFYVLQIMWHNAPDTWSLFFFFSIISFEIKLKSTMEWKHSPFSTCASLLSTRMHFHSTPTPWGTRTFTQKPIEAARSSQKSSWSWQRCCCKGVASVLLFLIPFFILLVLLLIKQCHLRSARELLLPVLCCVLEGCSDFQKEAVWSGLLSSC